LGGTFTQITDEAGETYDRQYFAAIDLQTKELLDYAPDLDGIVTDIESDDQNLFIAGEFTEFDGAATQLVAFVDKATLTQSSFNPGLVFFPNSKVENLEVDDENLYIVGDFNLVPFLIQPGIAAIDKSTDSVLEWPTEAFEFYDASDDKFLTCLAVENSKYFGGDFDVNPTGNRKHKILEVLRNSGQLGDFDFSISFECNTKVEVIEDIIDFGNSLLVAGLMKIDCSNATPPQGTDTLQPSILFGQDIPLIPAGESLTDVGGIGIVNKSSGEFSDFGTGIPTNADNEIGSESVYFNGQMRGFTIAEYDANYFFGARGWMGEIDSTEGAFTEWNGSGFDWERIRDYNENSFSEPLSWDWYGEFAAFDIKISDDMMYVGGDFEILGGQSASRFAIYDLKCQIQAGLLTLNVVTEDICLNDASNNPLSFDLLGNEGDSDVRLLVDIDNNIEGSKFSGNFNTDNFPPGQYFFGSMSFNNINTSATNLNDLSGSFDLSNFIPVSTFLADGGTISTSDDKTLCVDDPDLTVQFDVSNASDPNQSWVLVSSNLSQILETNSTGFFDFDTYAVGTYKVAHVSPDAQTDLTQLTPSDLPVCFDNSNLIKIKVQACGGAAIETSPNPTTDISKVNFHLNEKSPTTLEVFDLTGKRIGLIFTGMA